MISTNQAIVLSKIKYRDNDLIVRCYTLKRGVVSYLIRNAYKSKNNRAIAYYQPLSQLSILEKYNQNQSLRQGICCIQKLLRRTKFKVPEKPMVFS